MKCNKERKRERLKVLAHRIVEAWEVQTAGSATRLETQGGVDAAA